MNIIRCKIGLVGDPRVGKTSMISQLAKNNFNTTYQVTLGIDYNQYEVRVKDTNYIVQFHILDFSGYSTFRELIDNQIKDVKYVLYVYDSTNLESFQNIKLWVDDISKLLSNKKNTQQYLIGNKNEIPEKIVTDKTSVESLASNLGLKSWSVSARLKTNLKELFEEMAQSYYESYMKFIDKIIRVERSPSKKKHAHYPTNTFYSYSIINKLKKAGPLITKKNKQESRQVKKNNISYKDEDQSNTLRINHGSQKYQFTDESETPGFTIKNIHTISNKISPNTSIKYKKLIDEDPKFPPSLSHRHKHAFSATEKKNRGLSEENERKYSEFETNNRIYLEKFGDSQKLKNKSLTQFYNSSLNYHYDNKRKNKSSSEGYLSMTKTKFRPYSQTQNFERFFKLDQNSISQSFFNPSNSKQGTTNSVKKAEGHLSTTLSSRLKATSHKVVGNQSKYLVLSVIKNKALISKNENFTGPAQPSNITYNKLVSKQKDKTPITRKIKKLTNFDLNSMSTINEISNSRAVNYLKTDANNTPVNKINFQKKGPYDISIVIFSNWGNKTTIGITEIQFFSNRGRKIPIRSCQINNTSESNIGRIHNNKVHTINDNDMWSSTFKEKMKIDFSLMITNYNELDYILLWNYNGKDLTRGMKHIKIMQNGKNPIDKLVNKGCYNLKTNYSCRIDLKPSEKKSKQGPGSISDRNVSSASISKFHQSNYSNNSTSNLISNRKFPNESIIDKNETISDQSKTITFEEINKANFLSETSCHRVVDYVVCRSIRIKILSNYGHPNFVGLTGLAIFDKNDHEIKAADVWQLGAEPKDLREVYNDLTDDRIFENLFNEEDKNTIDERNMWLTTIHPHTPYIEMTFDHDTSIKKINFWNFNAPYALDRGAKEVEIVIDNIKIYKVLLRKGIGDYNELCQTIQLSRNAHYNQEVKNKMTKIYSGINFNHVHNCGIVMPSGFVFKIILVSNYGNQERIRLKGVKFYDKYDQEISSYSNYSMINKYRGDEDVIYEEKFFNFKKDENSYCNNVFYIVFSFPVAVSYVQLINDETANDMSAKRCQIYCDDNIIFEGRINQTGNTFVVFDETKKAFSKNELSTSPNLTSSSKYVETKDGKCFCLSLAE